MRAPGGAGNRGRGGFARLWAAAAVSNLGDGLRLAAFPLLAASLTRDPALVAGVTVAVRLPWLVWALPAGSLADRMDRGRLMILVSAGQAVVMTLFGAVVLAGSPSLAALYVAAFLLGVGEVTFDTTAQTIVPALVDRRDLDRANGRLVATERLANELVGPPLGSALFALVAAAPFIADAVTFAIAAVLLAGLAGTSRAARPVGTVEAVGRRRAFDGFRWLWHHRLLRSLTVFGVAVNLGSGAATAVLVLFALETLALDPLAYGPFLAVLAAGGLAGAVLGPRLRARIGPGSLLLSAAGVQAVGYGLAAVATGPVMAGAALALAQAGFFAQLVVFFALRQALVPDHLLGRVTAAMRLVGAGSLPAGAALGGVLASELGLRAPFVLAAGSMLLVVVVSWRTINDATITRALAASAR